MPNDIPRLKAPTLLTQLPRAALSAIPSLGGPLAELFDLVISPALVRRRDEWFKELADVVDNLEQRSDDLTLETLVNDEHFVSAVIQTTRTAVSTHESEKRIMLRNALLNSVVNPCTVADMENLFFSLIDSFSVSHIKILKFMWSGVGDLNKAEMGSLWTPTSIATG